MTRIERLTVHLPDLRAFNPWRDTFRIIEQSPMIMLIAIAVFLAPFGLQMLIGHSIDWIILRLVSVYALTLFLLARTDGTDNGRSAIGRTNLLRLILIFAIPQILTLAAIFIFAPLARGNALLVLSAASTLSFALEAIAFASYGMSVVNFSRPYDAGRRKRQPASTESVTWMTQRIFSGPFLVLISTVALTTGIIWLQSRNQFWFDQNIVLGLISSLLLVVLMALSCVQLALLITVSAKLEADRPAPVDAPGDSEPAHDDQPTA